MEWGIKLKNNQIIQQIFWELIVKTILYIIVTMLVFLFFLMLIAVFDFQWLYDFSPFIYNGIRNIFYKGWHIILFIGLCVIEFLYLLFQLLKKNFSYIQSMNQAIDRLFDKSDEYLTLPKEMNELEKKMNLLKSESLKNERKARESEQKKDELIVYLAHDIKTPLTSMIGYLSLLDEIEDMPTDKRKQYIQIALDKSYRLEDLINELFEIARFNSETILIEKEKLNLTLMLTQIIDDFYPTLNELHKTITLNVDESINIMADSDKLSRVFSNLIKNAIAYSKDESEIVIHVSSHESDVQIDVINKGKQIPQEKLDKIFQNFYRLDTARNSKKGGSGLGLAIAKEIIELHNGKIYAQSSETETTFTVCLPKY